MCCDIQCLLTFSDTNNTIEIQARVKNVCYAKTVTLRVTDNAWGSYEDRQLTYVESDSADTDLFSISIPCTDNIEFCLRYTPGNNSGDFWANNCNEDYHIEMLPVKLITH